MSQALQRHKFMRKGHIVTIVLGASMVIFLSRAPLNRDLAPVTEVLRKPASDDPATATLSNQTASTDFDSLIQQIGTLSSSSSSSNLSGHARAQILSLEQQAVDQAFVVAERERSEATLNELLKKIALEVEKTGIDTEPAASLHRIIQSVDGDQWKKTDQFRFDLLSSFDRNQGVAVDREGHFWFSGKHNLLLASAKTGDPSINLSPAIPEALQDLGDNHIGGIDISDGKLYAAIEDSGDYKNPVVGVYDAKTLGFEKALRLSPNLQPDGLPWVAVDSSNHLLYSSQYEQAKSLNVYDLSTSQALKQIGLSQPIESIQGAAIVNGQGAALYNGMMYLSSDGPKKLIYKVNLATGTVIPVIELESGRWDELEGLALHPTENGLELYLVKVGAPSSGNPLFQAVNVRTELVTFTMAGESRRSQFLRRIQRAN